MADVFVSYKRENLALVAPIVGTLRAAGLTVWWDQDIVPDAPWEATIEHELSHASCVIVAWSNAAVQSEYVKAEARQARTAEKLLQVFVEVCSPPLFFGERQGVDLVGWKANAQDKRTLTLVTAATALKNGEKLTISAPLWNPPHVATATSGAALASLDRTLNSAREEASRVVDLLGRLEELSPGMSSAERNDILQGSRSCLHNIAAELADALASASSLTLKNKALGRSIKSRITNALKCRKNAAANLERGTFRKELRPTIARQTMTRCEAHIAAACRLAALARYDL